MQTAKEILQAARDAAAALRDLQRQRDKYGLMIGGTGMKFGAKSMSKNNRSMVEDIAIKIADLDAELMADETVYLECIMAARKLIARIKNPQHQRVLTLRYLCAMSWADISAEMQYKDPKSVYRAHGWALKDAQETLPKGPAP